MSRQNNQLHCPVTSSFSHFYHSFYNGS